MDNWECGVCGYIHKASEAPGKCPICEAPKQMFTNKAVEGETGKAESVDIESTPQGVNNWECGVCGYIHEESEAPEKCPICEAPKVMFIENAAEEDPAKEESAENMPVEQDLVEKKIVEEEPAEEGPAEKIQEEVVQADDNVIKTWRCTVSGYLHTGLKPPEKCPICEATAEQFEVVDEKESEKVESAGVEERRWRCVICGYIHLGDDPPDECPVCGASKSNFVEIDADGKTIGEVVPEPIEALKEDEVEEKFFLNTIGKLILKFHLHPITVHFPNGILPAVVIFLAIAVYFKIDVLEKVAYFNLIFVLITLPVVLVTGWVEWQKRYRGIKTAIFIIKIICAFIVLASVNILVFWRLIDPQVAVSGGQYQTIYLSVAGVMLAAAGIAGHLGGKLAFASRA